MIEFFSENDFTIENQQFIKDWIAAEIVSHKKELGDITYIFSDDDYLHKINLQFLNHDTLTDIISFDNSLGNQIHGEIYISTERVLDNANDFNTIFDDELHRVLIHGILHFCGYKDKTKEETRMMRKLEDIALSNRTFL